MKLIIQTILILSLMSCAITDLIPAPALMENNLQVGDKTASVGENNVVETIKTDSATISSSSTTTTNNALSWQSVGLICGLVGILMICMVYVVGLKTTSKKDLEMMVRLHNAPPPKK